MEDIELISCSPDRLYQKGGFYDWQISLESLLETSRRHRGHVNVVTEIFPAQPSQLSPPAMSITSDLSFADAVESHYREIEATYQWLAPTLLVRIRNAIIWQNMIFVVIGDQAVPIYELYRAVDRTEKGKYLLSQLAACEERERIGSEQSNVLFIGSAGSFNYGHWLVDDFPSLAAARELRRNGHTMTVLMSSFFEDIDRTRIEGTGFALGEANDYSVRMLDRTKAYHVANLNYVTPSSYHPHLKNAHALRFIRQTCAETLFGELSCASSDKLFVNRAVGSPRRLVNNAAVLEELAAHGFTEVLPDELSLREQWATFANARQVVGIMGAAMTSSVLSPAGAAVTYLAPVGWIEPFYWNLAAMSGHRYAALFGPADESKQKKYRQDFTVDIDKLAGHLSEL